MKPWQGLGLSVFLLLRRILFWLHLATGLVAGLVILIMSVTGVLLMYERQITEWADRGYRAAPPSPGAARLPAEALLGAVLAARPGSPPTTLTVQSDPAASAAVSLGRGRTVYVSPYTGRILGEGSPQVRAFFRSVTDWHRWLGAGEESRDVGRKITGACNLAFLFLVLSGLYLWVPRDWTWRKVRGVLWFRRGLASKARDFNWHNVIGLWAWLPLVLIVFTGVLISYRWAGDLLERLAGGEPRARAAAGGGEGRRGPGRGGEGAGAPNLEGLDELWARAERQVPGWRSVALRVPEAADAPVTFTILQGHRGRPDLRSQLTLDRGNGQVVTWEPFASQSLGRRLRSWGRWVHTGEVGGLLGQTLAGLASAGAVVLVWTGCALAWRRLVPRRRERRAVEPALEPEAIEATID